MIKINKQIFLLFLTGMMADTQLIDAMNPNDSRIPQCEKHKLIDYTKKRVASENMGKADSRESNLYKSSFSSEKMIDSDKRLSSEEWLFSILNGTNNVPKYDDSRKNSNLKKPKTKVMAHRKEFILQQVEGFQFGHLYDVHGCTVAINDDLQLCINGEAKTILKRSLAPLKFKHLATLIMRDSHSIHFEQNDKAAQDRRAKWTQTLKACFVDSPLMIVHQNGTISLEKKV